MRVFSNCDSFVKDFVSPVQTYNFLWFENIISYMNYKRTSDAFSESVSVLQWLLLTIVDFWNLFVEGYQETNYSIHRHVSIKLKYLLLILFTYL